MKGPIDDNKCRVFEYTGKERDLRGVEHLGNIEAAKELFERHHGVPFDETREGMRILPTKRPGSCDSPCYLCGTQGMISWAVEKDHRGN